MCNISFAHNVFNRKDILTYTINNNLKYFKQNENKIYISSNGITEINLNNISFEFKYFSPNKGHLVGALEAMLVAMKMATQQNTSDIIIFSHDDVFINNKNIINKCIEKILYEDKKIILRNYYNPNNPPSYFMFDAFIIKTNIAIEIFKEIETNINPSEISIPELYFENLIKKSIPKKNIFQITYNHPTWYETEIGFFHIPSNHYDSHIKWDKNYDKFYT